MKNACMIIVYLYTLLYNTGTRIYLRRNKKGLGTITNKKNLGGLRKKTRR